MKERKKRTAGALRFCFCLGLAASLLCAGCGKQAAVETMAQGSQDGVSADSGSAGGVSADAAGASADAVGVSADAVDVSADVVDVSADSVPVSADSVNGSANIAGAVKEDNFTRKPVQVKGIYITGPIAGNSRMQELLQLVEETELNAMVIDIKNDEGVVSYDMPFEPVQEIGAAVKYVPDMKGLVDTLHEKGIYAIARIVSFKDPKLAEAHPEWAVLQKDGQVFRDRSGQAWVNPYQREVWEYLLGIAEQAAAAGFDEIQFDYIRFATDLTEDEVDFGPEAVGKSKTQIIAEFTQYAYETLHPLNVFVSADVYGTVMDNTQDQSLVGQDYVEMARHLDSICPMIYPSHYKADSYNIPVPDADPHTLIYRSLRASKASLAGQMYDRSRPGTDRLGRLMAGSAAPGNTVSGNTASENTVTGSTVSGSTVSGNAFPAAEADEIVIGGPPAGWETPQAVVRPWLQDFTATWVSGHITYGAEQIRDQIQAVYDAGYEEWILWNARNTYTDAGLLPAQ